MWMYIDYNITDATLLKCKTHTLTMFQIRRHLREKRRTRKISTYYVEINMKHIKHR